MDVSYIIAIWFLLLQCRLSLGECHCSVKSQCNLHQTTCESGCEAGFTGSRCQYENLLLGHILDPFYRRLVDGNMTNCFTYHRDIYARDIKSADRVNTLRIRYAAGRKCGCKELELCKTQCPDGCRGGYMGPLCKYKCSVGYYEDGQDCTQCGAGCNGGCDGPNGHCTCKTGWTGTRCKNCEGGYYMDRGDCVECGAGCDLGTCNANTGTCICRPGWRVPGCAILCPPGIYGEHCRLNCSAGCVNQTCDRVDGTCDVCLPGWNMAKCDNKVLMQTSGSCLPSFVLWSSITTIVTVGAAVLRPAILV